MRLSSVAAAVVLGLSSLEALACTCGGAVEGREEQWVEDRLKYADIVVLARVASVSGDFPKSAVLKVQETIKGPVTPSQTVRENPCPGYRPAVGDLRVFFLQSDGQIVGCSTFEGLLSTTELLAVLHALRRQVQPNTSLERTRDR
jgi:hypothetical protein